MKLFDEDKAFEQIVEEGMFPFFSNSFWLSAITNSR